MAQAIFDVIRTLAFGGISGTYAKVGTALAFPTAAFKITNNTNGDLFFSNDGTNNQIFVPANSFTLYDVSSDSPASSQSGSGLLPIGTQWWVKQSSAPSSGAVYIETLYMKGV